MIAQRLFALRGATRCLNEAQDITAQVAALYDELVRKNGLTEADIVSVMFSVTRDLDALNPAAALRQSGRGASLALFAVQEAFAQTGLDGVVRVLIHCYMAEGSAPYHVYRNGAEALRPDRASGNPGGEGPPCTNAPLLVC
jgi:chorismate mutase